MLWNRACSIPKPTEASYIKYVQGTPTRYTQQLSDSFCLQAEFANARTELQRAASAVKEAQVVLTKARQENVSAIAAKVDKVQLQ